MTMFFCSETTKTNNNLLASPIHYCTIQIMKKIIAIFTFLIIILLGGYIFFFQIEETQNVLNKTQHFISQTKEAIKETPIQDLISDKPKVEELIKNENLYTAGWIPYWDENRGFEIVSQNSKQLNSVSPTWFYVNVDGTLTERNPGLFAGKVAIAHKNNVTIIPTISNPSSTKLSVILNDTGLRTKHINEIITKVETYNFDGIDIDYENLEAADRSVFSTFIEELAYALHAKGKVLTIAVLPKSDNIVYQFSPSRQAQDWGRIGAVVDEFRIMGYDWTHNSTTDAGAISPTYWLEEILGYALSKVEKEKIVLGLPLYGYYWKTSGVSALTWEDVEEMRNNGATTSLDTASQENVLTTNIGTAWYQNAESIEIRRDIARKFGIKGVIYWRLGGEDHGIWEL